MSFIRNIQDELVSGGQSWCHSFSLTFGPKRPPQVSFPSFAQGSIPVLPGTAPPSSLYPPVLCPSSGMGVPKLPRLTSYSWAPDQPQRTTWLELPNAR